MAVSKRLRYEVLRRDNHQCRYCGATAPDAVLTVDHVIPVALGGSDLPSNLVAACADCNAGKSAAAADEEIVEDVAADSLAWRAALQDAARFQTVMRDQRDAQRAEFLGIWNQWTYRGSDKTVPLPDDWSHTVDRLLAAGLEMADLSDCVTDMMTRGGFVRDEFAYFCGVAWRLVEDRQRLAAEAMRKDGR